MSLLFSDMVMPGGMNGYELEGKAMKNRSDLRVLLTSGHAERAEGKASSKTDLLMRPYTHAELTQRVRLLLDESETATS